MPDYGDDRGFRSRGVPSDIGFDRAGPVRGTNYNEGYRPGDVTLSDLTPRMERLPTPIQTGGSRGEFAPPLYSGRNPFIQPIQTGGSRGEFPPMSSGQYLASRFGGGIDDAAGMNENARGMIEDAGFEVAGGAYGSGSKSRRDNIIDIDIYNRLVDQHGQLRADEIYGEYLKKKYKLSGTGAPSGEYIQGGTKLVT